jgi:PKD repeat protein
MESALSGQRARLARLAMTDGAGEPLVWSLRVWLSVFALALAAVTLSACLQEDATPDPFVGPSELGLSLTLTASPDVLPLDGASQSLVTVFARDGAGQALPNVTLRLQIFFGGILQDVGQLSAGTLVTGQDGRTLATYTAPLGGSVDTGATVDIRVTPVGENFATALPRTLTIRLVPSGIVIPPASFTADFQSIPSSPTQFQDVLFLSTDQTGQIVDHAWDFGDETTGTGASVTHVYSSPATYTVTHTATDQYGRSAAAAGSITVSSGGTPSARFTVSPTSPNLGDTLFFNASASIAPSGRSVVSYDWTFGDGGTASGATVSHSFATAGSYRVTLTVTDSRGATGATDTSVTVANSQPTASFLFSPSTPSTNTPVFFDASASRATVPGRTLVSYDWIFGDGSTGSGVTTSHSYTFASTFTVSLTVTDSIGESQTSTATVTVGGAGGRPTASFTVSPSPTTVGLNTTVDASVSRASPGSTITGYVWDFGETGARFQCPGDTACGDQNRTFVHRYSRTGAFEINLTVTDSTGQTASTTQTITVSATTDPTASFTASPSPTLLGSSTVVDASASVAFDGATITLYTWNFGDSTTTTTCPAGVGCNGAILAHTYASTGSFTITLTVTDSLGQTGTTTGTLTVNSVDPPTANLTASPTSIAAHGTVNFDAAGSTAASGRTVDSYSWNFGDGTSLVTATATTSHPYATAGTYQATLTVTDSAGDTSAVVTVTITIT